MSILKRSKEKGIATFRTAVSASNPTDQILSEATEEIAENQTSNSQKNEGLSQEFIDEQARRLLHNKGGRPQRRDRLNVKSRRLTLCLSPREEAMWRHCANAEDRDLSSWIRRAVNFYVTKHH